VVRVTPSPRRSIVLAAAQGIGTYRGDRGEEGTRAGRLVTPSLTYGSHGNPLMGFPGRLAVV